MLKFIIEFAEDGVMNINENVKGLCLFLGMIGLAYVAVLLLIAFFTGIKIVKSIAFIAVFCSGLISIGLTAQVKRRLVTHIRSFIVDKLG